MTKSELEEYAGELEGVIDEAYSALQDDDPDRAMSLLAEYVGEDAGEGDEADQNPK